jgi:hypothetical protein
MILCASITFANCQMTFAFQIVAMARYFFDSRDADGLMRDEEVLS